MQYRTHSRNITKQPTIFLFTIFFLFWKLRSVINVLTNIDEKNNNKLLLTHTRTHF